MTWGRVLGRMALAGAGALAAQRLQRALRDSAAAERLERVNFRGSTVSLAGGPALAVSAAVTSAAGAGEGRAAAAALVAGLGSGAVGLYDDVVGQRPEHQAKGFRGHLGALQEGRVTSGFVKIVGVGAAGLVASALVTKSRGRGRVRTTVDTLLGAGVIAGSANLFNLLDLRPGRALKAGVLVGTPLSAGRRGGLAVGPVGAASGLLPTDLGEETMLGDCGANAYGALMGTAYAARTGVFGRLVALAGLAGLTAASEKVSFTKVIESTPVLRELDELGRIPYQKPVPTPPTAVEQ